MGVGGLLWDGVGGSGRKVERERRSCLLGGRVHQV